MLIQLKPNVVKEKNGVIFRRRHVVHGAIGCGQKKLSVRVAVPPAPVRVLSQRPFAPRRREKL